MKIKGKDYRTIWFENNVVKIIDQIKLPHRFIIKDLKNVSDAINAIIIAHDKDHYNSPNDYSLFKTINSVKFVNLTNSGCKKAEPMNNYHGITLTKCYADYERKNKDLIKYLNDIF